jgi:predicted enzyme related to lactoylglutathione lyase
MIINRGISGSLYTAGFNPRYLAPPRAEPLAPAHALILATLAIPRENRGIPLVAAAGGHLEMLKQFSTLMVYVTDMDRSVAFYGDVLGLPLEYKSPGWSQFMLPNGVALGLHRAMEPAERSAGWLPGFSVDNIVAAKDHLEMASTPITQDYHDIPGGVVLEFADPDGNAISISQMGISCAEIGVAPAGAR